MVRAEARLSDPACAMLSQELTTIAPDCEDAPMTFNTETVYNELYPYFQKRVRQHEPLARHAAFGVGGPADVWLSLESQEELLDLVRLCAQEHWPLLVVGNGTNILFADAGVRGIVAHIALGSYRIEERSDGTALL